MDASAPGSMGKNSPVPRNSPFNCLRLIPGCTTTSTAIRPSPMQIRQRRQDRVDSVRGSVIVVAGGIRETSPGKVHRAGGTAAHTVVPAHVQSNMRMTSPFSNSWCARIRSAGERRSCWSTRSMPPRGRTTSRSLKPKQIRSLTVRAHGS